MPPIDAHDVRLRRFDLEPVGTRTDCANGPILGVPMTTGSRS